jgi:RND family efflux transporter MFP subunit
VIKRILGLARPLAILAVAVLIALFMINSRPALQARSIDVPLPAVAVQVVSKSALPVTVIAHGNVQAWRELDLTAEVGGRIISRSPDFEPGVVVAAGETLLRIDPINYELALAEAKQALATAEISLADAKALRQAARQDEAKASVAAAKARIARAQRDLDSTRISVPFNVVIDERRVELGQFVNAGTSLGRVLGADKAEIRLPIPPQDIGFVSRAAGTRVTLYADLGSTEKSWPATLTRIEARIDELTRVYPVVVEIESPLDADRYGTPLPFGAFVRAEITGYELADAILVPQSALHGDNDVFLLVDGALVRRKVKVSRISSGNALIVGGLEDGDEVVTTRLDLMFQGMQVARING